MERREWEEQQERALGEFLGEKEGSPHNGPNMVSLGLGWRKWGNQKSEANLVLQLAQPPTPPELRLPVK